MWNGFFEFIHRNRKGEITERFICHNELADEGEQSILDLFFRNQNAPISFELALVNDTPVDTDKVKDLIGEPTTNGYLRQTLNRDLTDWPVLELDTGDYRVVSKPVTFVASGGDWGPVTYGVLIAKGLEQPTDLTVIPQGVTGTTTWAYRVSAVATNGGETVPCAVVQITNGNAVLDTANYNRLSWSASPGAAQYKVYRVAAGGAPSTTGLIAVVSGTTYDDQGAAGDGSSCPLTDTSGRLIAYAPLSRARTLYDGESLEVKYFHKQK